MNVYLVQHAEAKPRDVDPDRALTEGGRQDAEHMAALAGRLGLEVSQIRHSGKVRAQQTAEIFGRALAPPRSIISVAGLDPADDVQPIADEMAWEEESIMLVGHLPFMERLAALMLTGQSDRSIVRFHKAGIVCLVREDAGGWQLAWSVTPQIARA